ARPREPVHAQRRAEAAALGRHRARFRTTGDGAGRADLRAGSARLDRLGGTASGGDRRRAIGDRGQSRRGGGAASGRPAHRVGGLVKAAWLDGVNPVTKIVLALLLSVPLFASIDPVSAMVAIVLQLLCLPLTGLPVRTVLRRMLPIALFSPIAG